MYLAVLPLVHYSQFFAGERFEEVMTLVPDRNFASEFDPNAVDLYINTFRNAAEARYGGLGRKFQYEKFLITNEFASRIVVVVTPL